MTVLEVQSSRSGIPICLASVEGGKWRHIMVGTMVKERVHNSNRSTEKEEEQIRIDLFITILLGELPREISKESHKK